jgi:hypothetical protein
VSDTLVHPDAVVVEAGDAVVADTAVLRSRWLGDLASRAVLFLINHVIIGIQLDMRAHISLNNHPGWDNTYPHITQKRRRINDTPGNNMDIRNIIVRELGKPVIHPNRKPTKGQGKVQDLENRVWFVKYIH